MRRRREQSVRIALLDDAAEIHHRDLVAHLPDHAQVVADEEIGEPEPLLQGEQQVHHLRLDRDVERRDRLVAHQELRIEDQRARQHDALALAARQLVRKALEVMRREPDRIHHRQRLLAPLRCVPPSP